MAYSVDETKWIKHYSSSHKILLVGEGNFSFAACLATAFGTGRNMIATSLSSESDLLMTHPSARDNLNKLRGLGCTILHEVDAKTMSQDHRLRWKLFDMIVFNFPHAGFPACEISPDQIKLHQVVVMDFLRSAREMLTTVGEVHVTHKTTSPFSRWDILGLAKEVGLRVVDFSPFSLDHYPGYENKMGSGHRSDGTFPVGRSCTYKFAN